MADRTVTVQLKPMRIERMMITIEGISPLIQHKWSEKAKDMIREKHAGKKTKAREVRDIEREVYDATHFTSEGVPGIPLLAFKASIINAAHKDLGIEKTLVRKALFILPFDNSGVLPMRSCPSKIREDYVRVGMGSTDLRYRPQFDAWEVDVLFEYDADLLQPGDIVNLINRAGFGVGICEWRPEKGGDFGRFKVKQ